MAIRSRNEVRTFGGVPPVEMFSSDRGTPIVIDTETGYVYWLSDSGVVGHFIGWGVVSAIAEAAVDLTLDETAFTIVLRASGLNITLPQAVASLLGYTWTVILAADGDASVSPTGGDIIQDLAPGEPVIFFNRGASLSFRCIAVGEWGIV